MLEFGSGGVLRARSVIALILLGISEIKLFICVTTCGMGLGKAAFCTRDASFGTSQNM